MKFKKPSFKSFLFTFLAAMMLMTGIFFLDQRIGLFQAKQTEGTMEEASFASRGHHSQHHYHKKFLKKWIKYFKRSHSSHKCHQHNKTCYTENFQAPIGESGAVDILFVLQTSSSILPERDLIIAEINQFIATLPEESDFNIAVMLAHGSTSDLSGRLYRVDSEPIVLRASELSNAQIQASLAAKLTSAPQDPDSGGGEEGIYSLFRGITTPALLAESQAAGFFRPDAALGVVFIADQRDICAPASSGAPPETDPVKISARIRDCEGLTPQGLSNRLETLKGDEPLEVSGILYADSPVPADPENELGYGYLDVISLNPGVAIDIANDDISEGLSTLLELGGQEPVQQNSFTLSHSNVNAATVRVRVNGQDVPFQLQGDVVTVTQPIPAGATVVITYCVRNANQSQCKHKHGSHHGHHCGHGHGHGHGHDHHSGKKDKHHDRHDKHDKYGKRR